MIVTRKTLPPLDHFPQRATVLKKVARVCSREKPLQVQDTVTVPGALENVGAVGALDSKA